MNITSSKRRSEMHRSFLLVAALFATISVPALADTVAFNSTPTGGFTYGTGNDYSPANASVLSSDPDELALRLHVRTQTAPASDGSVYHFALGTSPINFDWSVLGSQSDASITLLNLMTNQQFSYDPFGLGNDDTINPSGAVQNSFQLAWAGIGFDPNVDGAYSVTL